MDATNLQTARPHVSGVRWSGLQSEPEAVFTPYDRNAPEEAAKREAFAASAKGRLSAAIRTIEQTPGLGRQGYELYGLYCRSVQASDYPMSREVGGAFVAILSGIDSDVARAALEAVGELLMQRVA